MRSEVCITNYNGEVKLLHVWGEKSYHSWIQIINRSIVEGEISKIPHTSLCPYCWDLECVGHYPKFLRHTLSKNVTSKAKFTMLDLVLVRACHIWSVSLFQNLPFDVLVICMFEHLTCSFEHFEIFALESFWKVILHMLVRAPQNSTSVRDAKLCFMERCVVMN